MKKVMSLFLLLCVQQSFAQPFPAAAIKTWEQQARRVTIIRDNWGIPHVYGKTDADAVFGLIYAQCEDDFPRVELNYIEKLGRLSEIKGESFVYEDLYTRMILDSAEAVADYKKSPLWLQKLLNAWADGINYFLARNPDIKPVLIKNFKPWYPLLWTDGSIGAISTGDIEPRDVRQFYDSSKFTAYSSVKKIDRDLSGSNGFAIAPSKSASGKAMLYINPHVTFYFRPEVQMSSDEGLSVYGAVTWGQFFVYQGFNAYCGWMHTSSNADVSDMYEEKIMKRNNKFYYIYNNKERPVNEKKITIRYLSNGKIIAKTFTAYSTHHGPIMAKRNGKWISVKSYNRSLNSLMQSWLRIKTKGFDDYKKVMDMRGNTSNNTVFADSKGNIAYWHGNYMPVRDSTLNWSKAVDGTISSTDWKGLHSVNETVHVYNPSTGWIQNCNSTPFTSSGSASAIKENYPSYMAPDGENFRGINAVRIFENKTNFSLDDLTGAGYDTYLPAFEILIPALIKNFEKHVPAGNMLHNEIAEAVSILKAWDYRAAENSIATTIAIEWAEKLSPVISKVYIDEGENDQVMATKNFAERAAPEDFFLPLRYVVKNLTERFGTWKVEWGQVNRYQRLTGNVSETYDDNQPSLPVRFTSSTWGCLPAFHSRRMQGSKKRYGTGGNSFICAVEFGTKVKAKSLLAGGVNRLPSSPHFNDQAEMYTQGRFKDVLFYKEDVEKNAVATYQPGFNKHQ
jgi:acyl-homoserine-lactone acylase